MKTKHTPGPWRMEDNWDNYPGERKPGRYNIRSQDDGWNVARVWEAEETGPFSKEQVEANARLIAAAPELLEACEWALSELAEPETSTADTLHETIERLKTAIKKATL